MAIKRKSEVQKYVDNLVDKPKTEEAQLPKTVRMDLEIAIKLRAKAKGMEVEAKSMTTSAKETIIPILAAYSIKSYTLAGVGSVIAKVSVGSSIDATKLKESLLIAGVDIDVIEKALDAATKRWSTEYVEFKGEK